MFDPQCATEIGVEKSILLHGIMYWVLKNSSNNKHLHEGRYWMYNSASAFSVMHPYWNDQKVKRMLQQLESEGWILSGRFNQSGYDRTKWYSITDQTISKNWLVHGLKMTNGSFINDPPIPENTTNKYTKNNHSGESNDSSAGDDGGNGDLPQPPPPKTCEEIINAEQMSPARREALDLWLQYKKEKRQAYKPTGLRTLLKQWRCKSDAEFIGAVESSVASNYSGLFAKSGKKGGSWETTL